ncbi:MAG: glycosyltransferase [Planctomycetes bacterium]|nr:glycosyltransferase [Planctomycetota bacterium]
MTLRVLHIQDHTIPELSGYAVRSHAVVTQQRALGIDARVVSSARHPATGESTETIHGIEFHRTSRPHGLLTDWELKLPFLRERPMTAALTQRVLEVARDFQPHLLHAHSPIFDGWAARRASRALGIPYVYEVRAFWEDDAVDKRKITEGGFIYSRVRAAETSICRSAGAVTTICSGLRDDLLARGLEPEQVHVIPNGVDADRFQPIARDEALAARLGVSQQRVIGFVGSFFRYEGLPLLVEAFASVLQEFPNTKLILLGGGEDEGAVRDAVDRRMLSGQVLLPGRVPHAEVEAWYSIIDLLVYPRLSVRLTELVTPLKPLEAAAAGKSMLGSDVGGVKEILGLVGCKRLCRAGSVESLAEAIKEWMRMAPEEVRFEVAHQRQEAQAHCSWRAAIERILPIYGGLCPGVIDAAGARCPSR